MPRTATLIVMLGAALFTVTSCSSPASLFGEEEVIVLEVAPERQPCQGEMQDLCLQVRRPGEEEWRNFFDPIEGFDYEPGSSYTIEVRRRRVSTPPADGSSFEYELLEILRKEPAAG